MNTLKRARKLEFDEYTKRLHGPVRKKVRYVYEAARGSLGEAVSLVRSSKGKSKAIKVGRERSRAQEIENLYRERSERTGNSLRLLEHM